MLAGGLLLKALGRCITMRAFESLVSNNDKMPRDILKLRCSQNVIGDGHVNSGKCPGEPLTVPRVNGGVNLINFNP